MKKRGLATTTLVHSLVLIFILLVLLVLFLNPFAKEQDNAETTCQGIWKAVCGQYDADLGTRFTDYNTSKKLVCCVEKLCPGVWRDVTVCTSSAGGTSMGRSFSDADLKLNLGQVCCSQ